MRKFSFLFLITCLALCTMASRRPQSAGCTFPPSPVVVVLNDAQIRTLPTAPVVLISSCPAKAIIPTLVFFHEVWAADYANISSESQLFVSTGTNSVMTPLAESVNSNVSQLLAAGESASGWMLLRHHVNNSNRETYGDSGALDSDLANQPLRLWLDNTAQGDLAGGDPANMLTITVFFVTVDVP